jgi:hypothetical protein
MQWPPTYSIPDKCSTCVGCVDHSTTSFWPKRFHNWQSCRGCTRAGTNVGSSNSPPHLKALLAPTPQTCKLERAADVCKHFHKHCSASTASTISQTLMSFHEFQELRARPANMKGQKLLVGAQQRAPMQSKRVAEGFRLERLGGEESGKSTFSVCGCSV